MVQAIEFLHPCGILDCLLIYRSSLEGLCLHVCAALGASGKDGPRSSLCRKLWQGCRRTWGGKSVLLCFTSVCSGTTSLGMILPCSCICPSLTGAHLPSSSWLWAHAPQGSHRLTASSQLSLEFELDILSSVLEGAVSTKHPQALASHVCDSRAGDRVSACRPL